jgi:predicted dehydrogenase
MKFGLVGLGRWGKNYISSINQIDGSDIILCCSTKSDTYNNLSIRPKGFHNWTPRWEYVVNNPEVDTVIVATPPETHFEIALAALRNGKHVICEKPVTMNPAQVAILKIESENARRAFIVDYIHLWNPSVLQLISQFKTLGQSNFINHIISQGLGNGPERDTYSPLWDYGSHDISLILTCYNDNPEDVYIEQLSTNSCRTSYAVKLRFPKNCTAGALFGNDNNEKVRNLEIVNDVTSSMWIDDFKTPCLLFMLQWFITNIDNGQIPNNLNLAYRVETLLSLLEAKLK